MTHYVITYLDGQQDVVSSVGSTEVTDSGAVLRLYKAREPYGGRREEIRAVPLVNVRHWEPR